MCGLASMRDANSGHLVEMTLYVREREARDGSGFQLCVYFVRTPGPYVLTSATPQAGMERTLGAGSAASRALTGRLRLALPPLLPNSRHEGQILWAKWRPGDNATAQQTWKLA